MASVVVGATLTECIYTAVSVTALSNFMIHENWDSRHSRLQTLAAFAEQERSVPNAISTREGRGTFLHVSGWFQKSPSGTMKYSVVVPGWRKGFWQSAQLCQEQCHGFTKV